MNISIALFGILIAVIPQISLAKSECDDTAKALENKIARFKWNCSAGHIHEVLAQWDKKSEKKVTCYTDTAEQKVRDERKWAKSITNWCDENVDHEGVCGINATSDIIKPDPCPGISKELNVCLKCKSDIDYFRVKFSIDPDYMKEYDDETGHNFLISAVRKEVEPVAANFPGNVKVAVKNVTFRWNRAPGGSYPRPPYIIVELEASGQCDLAAVMAISQALNVTVTGMEIAVTGTLVRVYAYRAHLWNAAFPTEGLCSLYSVVGVCRNGGHCIVTSGKPECVCEHFYTGPYCATVNCGNVSHITAELDMLQPMGTAACEILPQVSRDMKAISEQCASVIDSKTRKLWSAIEQKCNIRG